MRLGSGAARKRVCLLPRGNHPHAARTGWGPSQYVSGSTATQGYEVKCIQTAGNVAKVSGFESSRPCGFCDPCLLKQVFNLPLFATGWKKVHETQTKVLQHFWLRLPGRSQRTWPTPTGGAIMTWDFSERSLTCSWSFPHAPSCSQHALKSSSESLSINTKELLDSEEHISFTQRTSAILSKLKQSCMKTVGFQNRCPAGKEKVKLLFYIKCTSIFLVHWLILIDKPWCYCSESSKQLYL